MNNTVADEEMIERREQDIADANLQKNNDLRTLMDMPEGRRFLKRLMVETCHMFGGGFCSSGSEMYYNSGSRSVGMNIKEQIEALSPAAFIEILNEDIING